MKIVIFVENIEKIYSGGRYFAFMIAEALAHKEVEVHYVTNTIPGFINDFSSYEKHGNIQVHLTKDFKSFLPNNYKFDIAILVPSLLKTSKMMINNFFEFAEVNAKKKVLINFETPNWIQDVTKDELNYKMWEHIQKASKKIDKVMSISAEGDTYAREYYNESCRFGYCHPGINSVVADKYKDIKKIKNSIVFFGRFKNDGNNNKGTFYLKELLNSKMQGTILNVIVGNEQVSDELKEEIILQAQNNSIELNIYYQIDDEKKFEILSKSELLVYPSKFEGYGLPPVEALYVDTKVICFNLPIIKEVCQENVVFIDKNSSMEEMLDVIVKTLADNEYKIDKEYINSLANFDSFSDKFLNELIGEEFVDSESSSEIEECSNDIAYSIAEDFKNLKVKEKIEYIKFYSKAFINHLLPGDNWLAKSKDIHKGKRCFIIGNGPSLKNVDLSVLKDEITFAVNGIYMKDNFNPTYYSVISANFAKDREHEIEKVVSKRKFFPADMKEMFPDSDDISWLDYKKPNNLTVLGNDGLVPASFSFSPDKYVFGGGTVLFSMAQLAFYFGISEIILLGVDHNYGIPGEGSQLTKTGMKFINTGTSHFDPNYRKKGEEFHLNYSHLMRAYTMMKYFYEKNGLTIKNATQGTRLDVFEKVNLMDVLNSK